MSDTQFLQRKYNTWIVVVDVPKRLRKVVGKARFKHSLGTDSLRRANAMKGPLVAEFKRRIRVLARAATDPDADIARRRDEAFALLRAANRHDGDEDRGYYSSYEAVMDDVRDTAREIEDTHGPEQARRFFDGATGRATFVADNVGQWLAEADVVEQTRSQHRAVLNNLVAWGGKQVTVEEIDRRSAGRYISELLAADNMSRRTVRRYVSSLSSFWRWLVARGLARDNVWTGHQLGKRQSAFTRRGIDDASLVKLLNARYGGPAYAATLHDLLRLGLVTGARLDELCALKTADCIKREDGWWLTVTKGKTGAARREIPLHELAVPIVERRAQESGGYLFAGLTPGGPDAKRSWYVSKAYRRFREAAGVDARGQDFHAIRNTFIEHMEAAGVPESTAKLIVGHARTSMTYGHYSKGARVDLRSAIERLRYAVDVEELIRAGYRCESPANPTGSGRRQR